MGGGGRVENTAENIEDYDETNVHNEPPQEEVPETDVPEIQAETQELGLAGEGQFGEGDGGESKEEEVMEDDPLVEGWVSLLQWSCVLFPAEYKFETNLFEDPANIHSCKLTWQRKKTE